MEAHFERLLEIRCKVSKPKIHSVNLEDDMVKTLDAFKDLGFCCSRSEVIRFILFYEFLKGVEKE